MFAYSNNGLSFRAVDKLYIPVSGEVVFADYATIPQLQASFPGYNAAIAPSPAALASAALALGIVITSATAGVSGTYACDVDAQGNISRMYNMIQRAGGAVFPSGLSSLAWPDINGVPHTFVSVDEFLALETAIGNYANLLGQVEITNIGPLPSNLATIS